MTEQKQNEWTLFRLLSNRRISRHTYFSLSLQQSHFIFNVRILFVVVLAQYLPSAPLLSVDSMNVNADRTMIDWSVMTAVVFAFSLSATCFPRVDFLFNGCVIDNE